MSCLERNVVVSALRKVRSSQVDRGSYQKKKKKKKQLNILVSFILGPI